MNLHRIAINIIQGSPAARVANKFAQEYWQDSIRYLIATDRSLGVDIRNNLVKEIHAAASTGALESGWHDTSEKGKGFRPGYVSFGLRPAAWVGLIGTLLITGEYKNKIKTKSPEPTSPEFKDFVKNGGNPDAAGFIIEMQLYADYYHKRGGGRKKEEDEEESAASASFKTDLGEALVELDNLEQVVDITLVDPDKTRKGIDDIIDAVKTNPPEKAKSKSKTVRKQLSPFGSIRRFIDYLDEVGRRQFYKDELEAVGKFTGIELYKIRQRLERAGKSYVPADIKNIPKDQLPVVPSVTLPMEEPGYKKPLKPPGR
jgi:hypothetical protein